MGFEFDGVVSEETDVVPSSPVDDVSFSIVVCLVPNSVELEIVELNSDVLLLLSVVPKVEVSKDVVSVAFDVVNSVVFDVENSVAFDVENSVVFANSVVFDVVNSVAFDVANSVVFENSVVFDVEN